jgi:hypothetical protein
MMPTIAAFAVVLSVITALILILGIFIKIGSVKQEIIEVRVDVNDLKVDLKAHGSELKQTRESLAEMKGKVSLTNTGSMRIIHSPGE